MATPGGLKPPTCWLEVSCSIQLQIHGLSSVKLGQLMTSLYHRGQNRCKLHYQLIHTDLSVDCGTRTVICPWIDLWTSVQMMHLSMPICPTIAILGSRSWLPGSLLWYKAGHQATYKLQNRECARPCSWPRTQDQVPSWCAGLCGHVYIIHYQLTCLGQ